MPHIHEKVDFTAEVFVFYENKVLLRKHDKYGIWLSVGGHIELEEDPAQAAVREVKEEVGLDVTLISPRGKEGVMDTTYPFIAEGYQEIIPPFFINRHRISDTHEHVTCTYAGIASHDKVTLSEDEKTDDCEWFTREQIEHHPELLENVRRYALYLFGRVGEKQ
ncbi:NUDIX domain-containing protein [Candidatus Nomurabacteria bacterium]|nr:NUDIX domain-containing protein [Candidatus Nomurabacteria bacterium]